MTTDIAWVNALVERIYQWEYLDVRKHSDGNVMIGMPQDENGEIVPP
jgi:hypothetical protein